MWVEAVWGKTTDVRVRERGGVPGLESQLIRAVKYCSLEVVPLGGGLRR